VNLRWSAAANRDRVAIFDFIELDDRQAAARIDNRILEVAIRLAEFPELGRTGRVEGTREFAVPNTPYLVVYRFEHFGVLILRLRHGAQQWPY
jgi:toxin ParE1/3/4